MATIVRREVRKRGFFGWLFLLLFLGFNVFMVMWMVSAVALVADGPAAVTEAEKAGRAIGAGIGMTFILVIWALGAVVTGLLALLTRGSRTIVTEEVR
jgi:hypothetical protein